MSFLRSSCVFAALVGFFNFVAACVEHAKLTAFRRGVYTTNKIKELRKNNEQQRIAPRRWTPIPSSISREETVAPVLGLHPVPPPHLSGPLWLLTIYPLGVVGPGGGEAWVGTVRARRKRVR